MDTTQNFVLSSQTIPIEQIQTVYLAGPMRGVPHFNFPLFGVVKKALQEKGFGVTTPVDMDKLRYGKAAIKHAKKNSTGNEEYAIRELGFNIRETMADDLAYVCSYADAIFCLPNWRRSRGATAEVATALAIGVPVYELDGTEVITLQENIE